MTIPDSVKIPLLKEFHAHLNDPEWNFMDSNEKDKIVLQEFPKVRILQMLYRGEEPYYSSGGISEIYSIF